MKLTGLWQYHVVHLQAPLFQTSVGWVWKKMEYAKSLVRGTLSTGFVRPQRPYRRPRSLRAAKFLHDLSDWGFVRQNSRSHFGTVLWNCNCLKIEGSHQHHTQSKMFRIRNLAGLGASSHNGWTEQCLASWTAVLPSKAIWLLDRSAMKAFKDTVPPLLAFTGFNQFSLEPQPEEAFEICQVLPMVACISSTRSLCNQTNCTYMKWWVSTPHYIESRCSNSLYWLILLYPLPNCDLEGYAIYFHHDAMEEI